MSKATELAKAEAARAEAEDEPGNGENGDEDTPEEGDIPFKEPGDAPQAPETPPEPSGKGKTPTSAEKQRNEFNNAMRAFHNKLATLFEVAELTPIETPGMIGFLLPGVTEEKTHPDYKRCVTCNGKGTVLTQSEHAGDERVPCPDPRCKGRGYWQKATATEPAPAPAITGPTVYVQPNGGQAGDEWGDAPAWMGDPRLSTSGA